MLNIAASFENNTLTLEGTFAFPSTGVNMIGIFLRCNYSIYKWASQISATLDTTVFSKDIGGYTTYSRLYLAPATETTNGRIIISGIQSQHIDVTTALVLCEQNVITFTKGYSTAQDDSLGYDYYDNTLIPEADRLGNCAWYGSIAPSATPLSTPIGLNATNITSNSALLGWAQNANASNFKIEYKINGDTSWTQTTSD